MNMAAQRRQFVRDYIMAMVAGGSQPSIASVNHAGTLFDAIYGTLGE
jgi:hypothetical protein